MQNSGQDLWMIRLLEDIREAAVREKLPASARAIDAAIEALKVESAEARESGEDVATLIVPQQKSWH